MSPEDWTSVYTVGSWCMVWGLILFTRSKVEPTLRLLLFKSLGAITIATWMQTELGSAWLSKLTIEPFSLLPFMLDWFWTMPLTLLILWCLANRNATFAGLEGRSTRWLLVSTTLVMLAWGLMAERAQSLLSWVWLSLAACLMAYILWVVWTELLRNARHQQRNPYHLFIAAATFVTVSWLTFPLLYILGPPGWSTIGSEQTENWFAIVHVVTKFGFFLLVAFGLLKMEREQ